MIAADVKYSEMLNSTARTIRARVELYNGSTLLNTYAYDDALQSITIDRVGTSGKFFGFGVCQKAVIKLKDKDRAINISKGQQIKVAMGVGGDYLYTFPVYYAEEVKRDENTNNLTITAYDTIFAAAGYTVSDLTISPPYTLHDFAAACAVLLGVSIRIIGVTDSVTYAEGANLNGTETIRDILDAIAEATQTVYYLNNNNELVFRRLDIAGAAVLTIDKSKYFTLSSKTTHTLAKIVSATELGDDVSASTDSTGETQYIRDNPFWDIREDIGTLVDNAIAAVGGLSITQFDCKWRGNFLLEPTDKINLITKDNATITTYVLNDVITYNGGLSAVTKWEYQSNASETTANPSTLGDALKHTYARVDKADQKIELVASETETNAANISSLLINTDSISASVQDITTKSDAAFDEINSNLSTLTSRVDAQLTAEDVTLSIQQELANGANKVVTETGFKFDSDGLTVSKTNSEMSTQITEDGMTVNKNGETMLTANNVGVNAVNLHATTYLIIGTNSRFENYGNNRTGCFWIGD